MRLVLLSFLFSTLSFAQVQSQPVYSTVDSSQSGSYEDWKWPQGSEMMDAGILAGGANFASNWGWGVRGTFAYKILSEGWVPEITNPLWFEVQFGPTFVKSATVWSSSFHLRWDFMKDDLLTLYALGGLGAEFANRELNQEKDFYPRTGIGAILRTTTAWNWRFEVSHEAVMLGGGLFF